MWNEVFPWQQPLHGDAATHWQLERQAPTPSLVTAAELISKRSMFSNCLSPARGQVPETLCPPSWRCPDWLVEVGETLRHDACKQVFHDRPPGSVSQWSLVSSSQVDHTRLASTLLVRFPLVTPPALEASPQCPRPISPILLKPFPCLCTSCAGLTPDLWRAPGPSETESEPGACSQTSWQRCWCTPAAG